MDNEINYWLEECSNQPISIWCEDPETHTEKIAGGVLERSYVTYRILMKQVGRDIIGVRHRYSEFETLRNGLKDQYCALGIAIPSLPPKTIIVAPNMMESFIKERTLGLTIFCEMVADSPWLRNDEKWKAFMRPNTVGSHESTVSENHGAKNVGEAKLISCLMKLEVPYKLSLLQRIGDLKQELQIIEKNAKILLDKTRALQSSERAYLSAQESLVDSCKQWLQSERTNIKTLSGKIFDESDNVLHIQQELPSHSANILSNLFTSHELALVESLKELLKLHDEMVASIESMKNKIHKVENSRAANRFELASEHRKTLEDKQSCLAAFYKGFIFFTLPYCARQRAFSLRKQAAIYTSSVLAISYTMQVACLQFFQDLSMNSSSVITDTCKILDLLKVKKLNQTPGDIDTTSSLTSSCEFSGLALSSNSTGMKGLYARSVCISFPDQTSTIKHTTTTEAAYASLSPTRQFEHNPLARRNSSNTKPHANNTNNNNLQSTTSSLMTEIAAEDEFQSQNPPPPLVPPPPPHVSSTTASSDRSISPVRLTEKSQHLIAELTNSQDNTTVKGIWD